MSTASALHKAASAVTVRPPAVAAATHRRGRGAPQNDGLYIGLLALNLLAWAWALLAFHDNPMLIGTALLAYGFGLRHAFDADHIVAIDNVTRKLMQEGRRPIAVGCFFALGHSTVVIVAAIVIALSASTVQQRFPGMMKPAPRSARSHRSRFCSRSPWPIWSFCARFTAATGRCGAAVSAAARTSMTHSAGAASPHAYSAACSASSRAVGTCIRSACCLRSASTPRARSASSALSAAEAAKGLPIWSILVFPALFTAGMALVDATDGILMVGAYGWALADPLRRVLYNLAITGLSVFVALAVGGIEAFGLLTEHFGAAGPIRDLAGAAGDALGVLGYAIVGLFALSWVVAIVVCRGRGIGKLTGSG